MYICKSSYFFYYVIDLKYIFRNKRWKRNRCNKILLYIHTFYTLGTPATHKINDIKFCKIFFFQHIDNPYPWIHITYEFCNTFILSFIYIFFVFNLYWWFGFLKKTRCPKSFFYGLDDVWKQKKYVRLIKLFPFSIQVAQLIEFW